MKPEPDMEQWPKAGGNRIASLIARLATGLGATNTSLDGVQVYREVEPSPRGPLVYRPGIIFVGQGSKNVHWGDRRITYDARNYLVLSVPLPVECEFQCSADEPLLALFVEVTPALVGEVLLDIDEPLPPEETVPLAMHSTPLDARMADAVARLLEALGSARESRVLGRQIVREIVYLALTGERGGTLGLLAKRVDRFDQMARVLREIQAHPSRDFSVDSLARAAHMSVSAFHSAFKRMTATSPVQYLKRIRLDSARRLMVYEGHTVSSAAASVGYRSVPQFSREFKRLFGTSPAEDAAAMREKLAPTAL